MEKDYQYFLGGFVLLMAVLFQYILYSIYNPFFFPIPLILLSLLLIITGIFEKKKYYNKSLYLVIVIIILVAMLVSIYIHTPTSLNTIIGAGIFILAIVVLVYDFILHINKIKNME